MHLGCKDSYLLIQHYAAKTLSSALNLSRGTPKFCCGSIAPYFLSIHSSFFPSLSTDCSAKITHSYISHVLVSGMKSALSNNHDSTEEREHPTAYKIVSHNVENQDSFFFPMIAPWGSKSVLL